MSVARVALGAAERREVRRKGWGSHAMTLLTSTDHKVIANMYFVTAFAFFGFGGLLALAIRAELAWPGLQYLHYETFNQFFTMHGTIMLLMFATPMFAAFANAIMPLQIGAPDVAFPRMNMLSYWLYLIGSVTACSGFLSPEGAAAFGWFAYAPLSDAINSPGVGGDLWTMGLYVMGLSTILGAVNFVTTIVCMRAPGLTMFRMPIFTWNIFVTSLLVLLVFPVLAAGLLVLEADRRLGTHILDPGVGGPVLWQHLFWFFGHPEVYIIALPFFGIITEILPVFSRKPIFGYVGLVAATLAIGGLSVAVWAHHMFVTGAVNLPFFSFMTFMIAVPTGVKFFNWIGTMWGGSISFQTPMVWAMGFLTTFLFGGLTGVILASPPLDFHVSDTYFVVAHFHYVLFGTVVFAMFGGSYGPHAQRAARHGALLDAVRRLPHDLPGAALAGHRGHAAPDRRLPAAGGVPVPQPDLHRRRLPARPVHAAVLLEHLDHPQHAQGDLGRSLGLGPFARMGHLVPAAAAQLQQAAADPHGGARLRSAPSRGAQCRPDRGTGRAADRQHQPWGRGGVLDRESQGGVTP